MTTRPHLNLLHLLGDEFDLLVEVILWGRDVLLHVIPSTDVNDLEVKANVVFCAGLIYYIWIFLLIYRLEPNWTVFSLKILLEMNEKSKKGRSCIIWLWRDVLYACSIRHWPWKVFTYHSFDLIYLALGIDTMGTHVELLGGKRWLISDQLPKNLVIDFPLTISNVHDVSKMQQLTTWADKTFLTFYCHVQTTCPT